MVYYTPTVDCIFNLATSRRTGYTWCLPAPVYWLHRLSQDRLYVMPIAVCKAGIFFEMIKTGFNNCKVLATGRLKFAMYLRVFLKLTLKCRIIFESPGLFVRASIHTLGPEVSFAKKNQEKPLGPGYSIHVWRQKKYFLRVSDLRQLIKSFMACLQGERVTLVLGLP